MSNTVVTDIPHDLRLVAHKAARIACRRQNMLALDECEAVALTGVWEAMQKHDPTKAPIEAFAYRCATNRARDAIRKEARRRRIIPSRQFGESEDGKTDEPAAKAPGPMVVPGCEREAFWQAVGRALAPQQATIVQAVFLDGLATDEAAGRLGVTPKTVRRAVTAAKAKLQHGLRSWA